MTLNLYGYGPSVLEGTWLTIEVAVVSVVLAVFFGMLGALARLSHSPILNRISWGYTTIVRGIPDLVLMLLIFFGGQVLINKLATLFGYEEYVDINPFFSGVVTLGLIFGAYMAETFRGAILAIPKGQLEAAHAFGMTQAQVFRRILFPQMLRHAIPGFGNNWLVLLKVTALVSVIGLEDLLRKAMLAAGATQKPFTFYIAVALVYLAMTSVSTILLKWAEHRANLPYRR